MFKNRWVLQYKNPIKVNITIKKKVEAKMSLIKC